jgi:small subunit ribosomal protein S16
MVRIRLMRVGSKKQPVYRVVITDRRNARDSRYIESIGYYNPRTRPHTVEIKEDRALYWLSVGAQPSESAAQLLKQTGTLERFGRFREGEDMEVLVAEAVAAQAAAEPISPKTDYPAPTKAASAAPVAELVETPVAVAEAVEEETVETEAEDAPEVETVAEIEVEDEADTDAGDEGEETEDSEEEPEDA